MFPVVGVFVKVPRVGGVKTRLGQNIGMENAAEFYAGCLSWIFLRLDREDCTFVVFYSPEDKREELMEYYPLLKRVNCVPQKGRDLGERMLHGLRFLNQHFDQNPVLIGSDSPDLPLEYIRESGILLDDNDLVVGPANDGGYYLVGMAEPRTEIFNNMKWSHSKVLDETLERANRLNLSFERLPKWRDYDRIEDFEPFLR